MNELALFAGAGGGILGGKLLGWRTLCAVECEQYAASILASRQNDGFLPPFPIWDDVQTFDGKPWKGIVDVVSGGFPCQDISPAGKGAGISGERSGMWKHMHRIIDECRPRYAFIENSPLLRTRGLYTVLQDLAKSRYDAVWGCFSAKESGANHERERIWILATDTNLPHVEGGWLSSRGQKEYTNSRVGTWWKTEPELRRVDDGVAYRVDRLKAIGNGQVPSVAARAFTELQKCLVANK